LRNSIQGETISFSNINVGDLEKTGG